MKRNLLISAAALAFVSAFALTPSFAQMPDDGKADSGTSDSSLADAMKADPDNYMTGMYVIDKKTGNVYLLMPDQAPAEATTDESKSEELDQSASPPVPPTSKSSTRHLNEMPLMIA